MSPWKFAFFRHGRRIAIGLCLGAFVLGLVGLCGWLLENETLRKIGPGWLTIKMTTAPTLIVCAVALYLSLLEPRTGIRRFTVQVLGAIVACFGLLVIAEYVFAVDFGFDSALFREASTSDWTIRGRPSPSSALNFALFGVALILGSGAEFRRNLQVVKSLGFTVFGIGIFAVAGYLAEALFGYHGWIYTGMAFLTAVSFSMLGLATVIFALLNDELCWSVDLPTTLVFFSGLSLMVLAAEMAYSHTRHLYDASMHLTHREVVLKELQEVEKGISDLQGALRNFLITADEPFLRGRVSAIHSIWTDLNEVKDVTRDNPLQRARVLEVSSLLARWLTAEGAAISARQTSGLEASVESLKSGKSARYWQALEEVLDSMEKEENRLRSLDRAIMREAASNTFLLLPLEAFLGTAVFLVALFSLDLGLRKRDQAKHDLRGH